MSWSVSQFAQFAQVTPHQVNSRLKYKKNGKNKTNCIDFSKLWREFKKSERKK